MGNPIEHAPTGPVDITFGDDGIDLNPWGVDARVVYTPGHSRSDCSVIVGDEAIDTSFRIGNERTQREYDGCYG